MEDTSLEGLRSKDVEYGVDKVILYPRDQLGVFREAVPWSGVTKISKKRVGKGLSSIYYDGIRVDVLEENLLTPYDLDLRINCITYPEVLNSLIGDLVDSRIGFIEESRIPSMPFGISYRTKIGESEHRIHVYPNVKATPSEITYQTLSSSPDLVEFSFDLAVLNPQYYTETDSFVGAVIDTSRTSQKLRDEVEKILYKNPLQLPSLSDKIKTATKFAPYFRLNADGTWEATVDEKTGYGFYDETREYGYRTTYPQRRDHGQMGHSFEIIVSDNNEPEYIDEYTWSLNADDYEQ